MQGVLDAAERYATTLSRFGFSAFGHGVSTLRACVVALMDENPAAKSLDVVKRVFDHFLADPPCTRTCCRCWSACRCGTRSW